MSREGELAGESLLRSISGEYVPGGYWLLSISSTSDFSESDVELLDEDESSVPDEKSGLTRSFVQYVLFTPFLTSSQYRAKRTDERSSNLRLYSPEKVQLEMAIDCTRSSTPGHRLNVTLVQALVRGRVDECFAFFLGFSVLTAHGNYECIIQYIHIILARVQFVRNRHSYCPFGSSTLKCSTLRD